MSQPNIRIPRQTLAALCRQYHICQPELFGSVLRNDFRADSDVDVLVEFEPGAQIGLFAFQQIQAELSALLQRPVDLVPRDGLKPLIRESVLASAQEIYAA